MSNSKARAKINLLCRQNGLKLADSYRHVFISKRGRKIGFVMASNSNHACQVYEDCAGIFVDGRGYIPMEKLRGENLAYRVSAGGHIGLSRYYSDSDIQTIPPIQL